MKLTPENVKLLLPPRQSQGISQRIGIRCEGEPQSITDLGAFSFLRIVEDVQNLFSEFTDSPTAHIREAGKRLNVRRREK